MPEQFMILLFAALGLLALAAISLKSGQGSLDGIKSKPVGDGQHGTARWATPKEIDGELRERRHIVSVFKLVQDLLEPSDVKGKSRFQVLMGKLPDEHKARWLAGAALKTSEQAMASILSTVLSRLNAFLDTELEQTICFDSSMDAEILTDNCQDTIFGGFAPNSKTAEVLSKSLGNYTVQSGSVSKGGGKDGASRSLQMMERPLMTPDELKAIPKGEFVVMKTGSHPMRTRLRLFLDWGITFEEPYQTPEHGQRKVYYAGRQELVVKERRWRGNGSLSSNLYRLSEANIALTGK